MPVYVGERYIPEAERSVALEQAARIRSAVMEAGPDDAPVRLLSTTFVPNEEWVFDLFEAQSADEVLRIYEVSGVPVERVTEGVHLPGP
jgi:hypothetical protein